MNDFVSHLFLEVLALGTASGMLVLLNIIIIDVVMSGDNAILIGLATKNLPPKERKVAILWGVILATILRVAFASVAVVLLSILGLKLAG
jgi:predicted tellurium resistance membrane protein TerC